MSDGAAATVRAMLADRKMPDRKSIERALRESLGFSSRQARAFCARGFRAIVTEEQAERDELLQSLDRLNRSLGAN